MVQQDGLTLLTERRTSWANQQANQAVADRGMPVAGQVLNQIFVLEKIAAMHLLEAPSKRGAGAERPAPVTLLPKADRSSARTSGKWHTGLLSRHTPHPPPPKVGKQNLQPTGTQWPHKGAPGVFFDDPVRTPLTVCEAAADAVLWPNA